MGQQAGLYIKFDRPWLGLLSICYGTKMGRPMNGRCKRRKNKTTLEFLRILKGANGPCKTKRILKRRMVVVFLKPADHRFAGEGF